jgi:hypothetical protein
MRHRFTLYVILLLGIIPFISLSACTGLMQPVLRLGVDMQWAKTFGGEYYDQGRSVQQTADGGYIVCGITMSYAADIEDIWVIKTDADGNKLWDKTFGGKDINVGTSAQQTTDGGYIVCGSTSYYRDDGEDIWLIKTDAEGNKLWDKAFGGDGINVGYSVQQTLDDGYIVCGITQYYEIDNTTARLIKTDAFGNKLWDKIFSDQMGTAAISVQPTTDGGYILCGWASSYKPFEEEVWLMKTDADGNKLWDKTFGGKGLAYANSVQQTTDGGYILCGRTGSYETGKMEALLIKADAKGNKLWDKTFEGKGAAEGQSLQKTTDGGYILCGTTKSHEGEGSSVLLFKVAPEQ